MIRRRLIAETDGNARPIRRTRAGIPVAGQAPVGRAGGIDAARETVRKGIDSSSSLSRQSGFERARRHHWAPGGSIMIHGLPNVPKRPIDYYKSTDWTDGCIALNNDDMLEVWLLTRANTPIEIRP